MKTKFVLQLLLLSFIPSQAQTLFHENMGTPSGTVSIASNAFYNSGSLSYSNGGQANSADVRITSASSGYANSSGTGNVYFSSTSGAYGLSIEGVNASNYNTLSLQFGYKKEAAASHATFSVDYWNGSSWITLANSPSTLFNEGSGAPAVWYLSKTLAIPADAQISGLKLRFVKTGTIAIRIDDVKLTGTENVPSVSNTAATSITSDSVTFAGNVTATGGSSITATGTVYSVTTTNANPVLGGLGVTTISTPSPSAGTGLFSNGSGTVLSPNVQYSYNAYATKSTGATGYGTAATLYTLAVTPAAPTVGSATGSSLNIAIGTDANPSSTTYAVLETTTGHYVQANGILGATAVYQTASVWGTKTVTGLSATTTYTFEAVAKNGAGVTTAAGPSSNGTTVTPNNNSDIVFNGSSSTSTNSNLPYTLYQGTTLTNTGSGSGGSIGVMGFYLRDGGAELNDADNLGTNLSAITFNITHWQNVKSARLFQGNSPKGLVVNVTGPTITFSGITDVTATDNAQLALSLRITFNSTVTDNDQLQFTIAAVTADSTGSQFAMADGGGASSALSGDINRVEVTASKLGFDQQPPLSLYAGMAMSPAPIVKAIDDLGNIDFDYSGLVALTCSGLLNIPQSASAIAGRATIHYDVMDYTLSGSGLVLTATATDLLTADSNSFELLSSPEIVLANLPPSNCNIDVCNLVVNGNFEQANIFPTNISQLQNACGWFNAYGTPDYFHESSTSLSTSIPCNFAGAQDCNNSLGNGYAGIAFVGSGGLRSEIMVSRLSSPLVAGQNYQLRFDISLAEGMSSFSKTVQAYLSPTTITITPGTPITIDNPDMLFSETSTISNGWETLTFNFTSTAGGEEFIYLGSFQNVVSQPNATASDSSCVYNNIYNDPAFAASQIAYYYLDNVQIIPVEFETNDDTFIVNYAVSDLVTGTILTNDTYNGNDLSTVPTTLTYTVTPVGTPPTIPNGGINLNPDGTYTVLADTTPGTYTLYYVITTDCGISNEATASITIKEYITSYKIEFRYCFKNNGSTAYTSTDSVTPYNSLYDLVDVLGVPASPSNATIQLVTSPIVPITINPDGTFSIESSVTTEVVPEGEYYFYYKVCSNSTSFCSQDIRCDIYIHNSVMALPDATTFYIDGSPTQSLNILANDFKRDCFDPVQATTSNVTITQTLPASFDPNTYNINSAGVITMNNGLITGVYYLEYKICDADFPDNCSYGYVWIYQCITGDCPPGKMADAGNNEGALRNEFRVSPNPSKANFTISFKEVLLQSGTFEVFDMLGKRFLSEKIEIGVSNSFVNLENYPAGVYVLKITIGNHTFNRKLVKE